MFVYNIIERKREILYIVGMYEREMSFRELRYLLV